MLKKMNNKGLTLVELLATIAILGIISSVVVVAVVGNYQNSKVKTEEIFYSQLENYVEDYISLYGSNLTYAPNGTKNKCYTSAEGRKICNPIPFYRATNNLDIISVANEVTNKNLINPATEKKCTTDNKVYIYRDSDFVYCFKILRNTNSCITEDIYTCDIIYE